MYGRVETVLKIIACSLIAKSFSDMTKHHRFH